MPKYYFQDLCSHLQDVLVREALEEYAEYTTERASRETLDDVSDYINRHNWSQTIPEWFITMQAYRNGAEKGGDEHAASL